jgi:hypothetical protein
MSEESIVQKPTEPDAPARATCLGRIAAIVVAVIGLCAIAALTPRVARVYPVSSDDATGVLEADAVLRGNVLLRGWTLSKVSFVTTDLPFYVAGVAAIGMTPSLLRDVPIAIYIAAVAVGAALARGRRGGWRGVLGMTALLVLLCLPAGGLADFVTKGYIRVGTTLGLLAALCALDVPAGRRVRAGRLAVFAFVLSLTILADSFALVMGGLPVLIVAALGARRALPYGALGLKAISLAVVAAVVAARGLSWLIELLGGYRVVPVGLTEFLAHRDTLQVVKNNVRVLADNLPSLYRCDLPRELSVGGIAIWVGCMIGPLLLVWALVRGLPVTIRGREPERTCPRDFVADVLWFSALLCLAAYIASSIPKDRTSTRYMVPFVLSGAVLTGRVLAQRVAKARIPIVALGVLGVSYGITVWQDLGKPVAVDPAVHLADTLERNGLQNGYGPFWNASVVTATSGGRVKVRPIFVRPISPERHAIAALPWMTDARWFRDERATFVVFEPAAASAYQFGVTEWTCERVFGSASARHEVGPYVVLIWGHDLRRELEHAP